MTFFLLCYVLVQVYQATSDSFWSQDKYFGRRLDAHGLRKALIEFFASGGSRRRHIIEAILNRLKLLRQAVEQQDTFRFYSRYCNKITIILRINWRLFNNRFIIVSSFSSLLIVYEGCEEGCESFADPRDFRVIGSMTTAGRSNSDCELPMDSSSSGSSGSYHQPPRSNSDAQIPRLRRNGKTHRLDFDSLSITDCSSSDYLTDTDAQSLISTSPQSVDSGLECLMEGSSTDSSSRFSGRKNNKRFVRLGGGGYECDNSTDSTDSGVYNSSRTYKKRSVVTDSSEESESSDVDSLSGHLLFKFPQQIQQSSTVEEESDLTPVLETSRTDEFDDAVSGQQKKRRMEDQSSPSPSSSCNIDVTEQSNCWTDYVDVRMIDFAHTTFSGYLGLEHETVHWGPDNGYLLGLNSLTSILSELASSSQTIHC